MGSPADPNIIHALTTQIIDLYADIHRAEYRLLTLIRCLGRKLSAPSPQPDIR